MKLRKELEKVMQYDKTFYKAGTDDLIALFKQWALEMVGEDKDDCVGYCRTREEIRQRIEESTK